MRRVLKYIIRRGVIRPSHDSPVEEGVDQCNQIFSCEATLILDEDLEQRFSAIVTPDHRPGGKDSKTK